jgi:GntR family transcriptional regulator
MHKLPLDGEVEMTSYAFVWKYCREDLVQSILEFLPTTAGKREAELFAIKEGSPMISWRELFYNIKDVPISYNQIFFNPDIMKLKMLRKW